MLHRGSGISLQKSINKSQSLLLCIGAISVFSLCIYSFLPKILRIIAVLLTCISIPMLVMLVYNNKIQENNGTIILGNIFLLNGVAILLSVVYSLFLFITNKNTTNSLTRQTTIIWICLAAVSLFIISFAPFIATRHILLLLPAILILIIPLWDKTPSYIKSIILCGTVLSGIILGISDWKFANYYRHAAHNIKNQVNNSAKVWAAGHWGWQWYCKRNGIETLGINSSDLKEGDYVIAPMHVSKQDIHTLNLTKVKSYWYQPDIFSFFSVSEHAGLYATSRHEIPWDLSKRPIDIIVVYRVNKAQ